MDKVFAQIGKRLQEDPRSIEGVNAIYQFEFPGEEGGTYQLHLADGKAKVEQEATATADCRIKMKEKDFMKMLQGRLNGTTAFMTGKLKVKGSMGLAMKLQNILGQHSS